MTPSDRFERILPDLLSSLVVPPAADDLTDTLTRTAALHQRPAWSFPKRWLPMTAFTARTAAAPRVPWRPIVLAIVVLALLLGALLVAGSSRRLPRPFGPAANGRVAFSHDGDIYTADPATGATAAIVTGPTWDTEPRWSRDGTHVLFRRSASADPASKTSVLVATADGRNVTLVTPDPIAGLLDARFAPDGATVLLETGGARPFLVASADGTALPRPLADGPVTPNAVVFRPPDGAQIAYVSSGGTDVYLADADGSNARPIHSARGQVGYPAFSPDGTKLAFSWWTGQVDGLDARIDILDLATGTSRTLPLGPGSVWESVPSWSNDGTRLAIIRGYTNGLENVVAAIIPVDGGVKGIETAGDVVVNDGCCLGTQGFEWAPDDTSVLLSPIDTSGTNAQQTLIDTRTGSAVSTLWTTTSNPAWQRLAP